MAKLSDWISLGAKHYYAIVKPFNINRYVSFNVSQGRPTTRLSSDPYMLTVPRYKTESHHGVTGGGGKEVYNIIFSGFLVVGWPCRGAGHLFYLTTHWLCLRLILCICSLLGVGFIFNWCNLIAKCNKMNFFLNGRMDHFTRLTQWPGCSRLQGQIPATCMTKSSIPLKSSTPLLKHVHLWSDIHSHNDVIILKKGDCSEKTQSDDINPNPLQALYRRH